MKAILEKLLGKRGIHSLDELDSEEKNTFEGWNAVLSKEGLTTADIKEFCQKQCDVIEGKWKDYGVTAQGKAELIPYHTVYKTLIVAIDSPRSARENLEKHLEQLINT
jgi:hypothetical protein